MPVPTHEVTIYRRSDNAPDLETLLDALAGTYLDETSSNNIALPEYEGATCVAFHWGRAPAPAPWTQAATRLIGTLPHDYESRDCGALLFLELGDDTYAIGFGSGSRAIPDQFKDPGFGLRFTIRAVDAEEVRGVVRRSLTGLGRQDATRVPTGIPIGHIGVSEYTELVRKLAGKVDPRDLGLDRGKPVPVEGAAGLRMRIPLDRDGLVALLRRISEICAREVQEDFAFVEAITPVRDDRRLGHLDEQLDERLRAVPEGETPRMRLASAVPMELVDRLDRTQSFRIKIGSVALPARPDLDLEDILRRCRLQHQVPPIEALRRGDVRMCEDAEGERVIGRASADQWLEASTCVNGREYFLVEGAWYEGGVEYFTSIRRQIAALFKDEPCVVLPPWRSAVNRPDAPKEKTGETLYNEWVEDTMGTGRMLNLDTKGVRGTGFHGSKGFEPCDLLGPGNELIHVKGGKGTEPFSHLFTQALISTEALFIHPDVVDEFARLVQKTSRGARTLPDGYRPRKVVFAMMIDRKSALTPDTFFPHAQIALAHLTRTLKSRFGVDVEVIAIPREADGS